MRKLILLSAILAALHAGAIYKIVPKSECALTNYKVQNQMCIQIQKNF